MSAGEFAQAPQGNHLPTQHLIKLDELPWGSAEPVMSPRTLQGWGGSG